jgi:peptide/nickel transport system permease protein
MAHTDSSLSAAPSVEQAFRRPAGKRRWQRFRRHRGALFGLSVLGIFSFMAVFAPWVTWHDHFYTDLDAIRAPPSFSHIFGTDASGRDVFARMVFAARVSLSVGLISATIASIIGATIGMVSGYVGGWVDNLLMRFTEVVMTFPTFFALIILVSVVGPSVLNLMIIMGVLGWEGKARLVRGQVLSLKEMDYVTASRGIGASDARLIGVHIFPGVLPFILVGATLQIAGVILAESGLSFIGLGVQIPTATWGNMMNAAQSMHILRNIPWLWVPPGLAISATVIAVNFAGDGLRDALDPRSGTSV